MKILAAIANHGIKNQEYLDALLREYRAMPHDVDVVILSDIPKDLGVDVEVQVGFPTDDPWSLPFGHKQLFADRIDQYDLFIYSEDDTLITATNVNAFVRATAALKDDEVAGFMRIENGADGKRHFPEVHGCYHWVQDSVRVRGPYTLAEFTCEHSACFILTRDQLRRAITSRGFLVPPHQEQYDLLVTAATDPYTQCGFKKLIPVSHLEDFIVSHLPNKYVGRMGLEESELRKQTDALMALARAGDVPRPLISAQTQLPRARWSKFYYDDLPAEAEALIARSARSVLSVGCGAGTMEQTLVRRGIRVVGVPLDDIIAPCAQAKGVDVVPSNIAAAKLALAGDRFDCLLYADVLHLAEDPVHLLSSFVPLLAPGGLVIVTLPNMRQLPVAWRRLRGESGYRHLGNFGKTGVQLTTTRSIRKWFTQSGLVVRKLLPLPPRRYQFLGKLAGGFGKECWAEQFVVVASVPARETAAQVAEVPTVGGVAH